jgi:hypothetical protein
MQVARRNGDIQLSLDSHEEALAVFAVLTNNPSLVTAEWFQKGQLIYKYFFHNIETLANNWEAENAHLYRDVKKRRGLG